MKTFNLHKFIVVLAAVLAPYIACARPIPPQVKTQSGWVEGNEAGGLQVFLGIPYAAPPVGELRWKPPDPQLNGRMRARPRILARVACRSRSLAIWRSGWLVMFLDEQSVARKDDQRERYLFLAKAWEK